MRPGLHGLDGSRDGGVNRHAQAVAVSDFLSQVYMVSLRYQGFTRDPDMLGDMESPLWRVE